MTETLIIQQKGRIMRPVFQLTPIRSISLDGIGTSLEVIVWSLLRLKKDI